MENGLSSLQKEVEDVTAIMLDNLNKSNERSEKLGELDDRAENLKKKSEVFSKTATKVKQKKRWENIKYKVIIAAIIAAVFFIIIVAIAVSLSSQNDESASPAIQSTKAP